MAFDVNNFSVNLTSLDAKQTAAAPLPQGGDAVLDSQDAGADPGAPSAAQLAIQAQQRQKAIARAAQDETTFQRSIDDVKQEAAQAGQDKEGATWSRAAGPESKNLSNASPPRRAEGLQSETDLNFSSPDVLSLQKTLDEGRDNLGDAFNSSFADVVNPHQDLDGLTAAFYALGTSSLDEAPTTSRASTASSQSDKSSSSTASRRSERPSSASAAATSQASELATLSTAEAVASSATDPGSTAAIGDEDDASARKKAETHAQHRAMFLKYGTDSAVSESSVDTSEQPQAQALFAESSASTTAGPSTDSADPTAGKGADESSTATDSGKQPSGSSSPSDTPPSSSLPQATSSPLREVHLAEVPGQSVSDDTATSTSAGPSTDSADPTADKGVDESSTSTDSGKQPSGSSSPAGTPPSSSIPPATSSPLREVHLAEVPGQSVPDDTATSTSAGPSTDSADPTADKSAATKLDSGKQPSGSSSPAGTPPSSSLPQVASSPSREMLMAQVPGQPLPDATATSTSAGPSTSSADPTEDKGASDSATEPDSGKQPSGSSSPAGTPPSSSLPQVTSSPSREVLMAQVPGQPLPDATATSTNAGPATSSAGETEDKGASDSAVTPDLGKRPSGSSSPAGTPPSSSLPQVASSPSREVFMAQQPQSLASGPPVSTSAGPSTASTDKAGDESSNFDIENRAVVPGAGGQPSGASSPTVAAGNSAPPQATRLSVRDNPSAAASSAAAPQSSTGTGAAASAAAPQSSTGTGAAAGTQPLNIRTNVLASLPSSTGTTAPSTALPSADRSSVPPLSVRSQVAGQSSGSATLPASAQTAGLQPRGSSSAVMPAAVTPQSSAAQTLIASQSGSGNRAIASGTSSPSLVAPQPVGNRATASGTSSPSLVGSQPVGSRATASGTSSPSLVGSQPVGSRATASGTSSPSLVGSQPVGNRATASGSTSSPSLVASQPQTKPLAGDKSAAPSIPSSAPRTAGAQVAGSPAGAAPSSPVTATALRTDRTSVSTQTVRQKVAATTAQAGVSSTLPGAGTPATRVKERGTVESIGEESSDSARSKAETHAQHRDLVTRSGAGSATSESTGKTSPSSQTTSHASDKAASTNTDKTTDSSAQTAAQSQTADEPKDKREARKDADPSASRESGKSDEKTMPREAVRQPATSESAQSSSALKDTVETIFKLSQTIGEVSASKKSQVLADASASGKPQAIGDASGSKKPQVLADASASDKPQAIGDASTSKKPQVLADASASGKAEAPGDVSGAKKTQDTVGTSSPTLPSTNTGTTDRLNMPSARRDVDSTSSSSAGHLEDAKSMSSPTLESTSTTTSISTTASISTASISTASISTASISTASVSTASISTASISTASVSTASVSTASISTASTAMSSPSTMHNEHPRLASPTGALSSPTNFHALSETSSPSSTHAADTADRTSLANSSNTDTERQGTRGTRDTSRAHAREEDAMSQASAKASGPSTHTLPPRESLTVRVSASEDAAAQLKLQTVQASGTLNNQSDTESRDSRLPQQVTDVPASAMSTASTMPRATGDADVRVTLKSASIDEDEQRIEPVSSQQAQRVRVMSPASLAMLNNMRISNTPPAGIPQPVLLMVAADIYRMQQARQERVADKDIPDEEQDGVAGLTGPSKKSATQSKTTVQGIAANGVESNDGDPSRIPHVALRAAIMTSALQQPASTMSMFVMSDETPAIRFFVRDEAGALQPQWIQKPADPNNEDGMFSLDPWVDFAETAWTMVHGPVEASTEVADNTALAVKAMETMLGSAASVQPVVWNQEARLEQPRQIYDIARETNDPSYTPTLAVTDTQVDPKDGLQPSHVYGVIAFYVEAEKPHVILLEAPSSDPKEGSFRLFDVPYSAFCRSVRALVTAIPGEAS